MDNPFPSYSTTTILKQLIMSASETIHCGRILTLLLLLLLLLVVVRPSLSKEENCHPDDHRVLLKIRKAMNIQGGWKDDQAPCCHWVGVFCDSTANPNRVTSLGLLNNMVSGRIPDAIGDLPYLQEIVLHKLNNISGPIPYSLTKLKYLTFIAISWVNLTGSIPGFLGQMKNLTYLNLSFNKLTGPIPSSIFELPKLNYIDLSRNMLTGTIPNSLVARQSEFNLYLILSHNQLTGEIPTSFAKIDFGRIELSRNKLQGDISMLFGHNKTTNHMDFSRNMFSFDMSGLQIQKSLVFFDINHNQIYGSIPEAMTGLALQSFNVSFNRLCGRIPQGGRLQEDFDYSAYFHNRCLCGAPLNVTCK